MARMQSIENHFLHRLRPALCSIRIASEHFRQTIGIFTRSDIDNNLVASIVEEPGLVLRVLGFGGTLFEEDSSTGVDFADYIDNVGPDTRGSDYYRTIEVVTLFELRSR